MTHDMSSRRTGRSDARASDVPSRRVSTMRTSRSTNRATLTRERRGSIIVWVGVMVVMMVAFGAMAVDFASFYVTANELQTATDASALAGAHRLQRSAGPNRAYDVDTAAVAMAARNRVMNAPSGVQPGNVSLVYWDETDAVVKSAAPAGQALNAVQVVDTAQTVFIFGNVFGNVWGEVAPNIPRGSVAWTANISGATCIKPFGFDMQLVYKMLGATAVDGPLTQAQVDAFNKLTPAQRTFVTWQAPNGEGAKQSEPITGWPSYSGLALTGQGGGVTEYQKYLGGTCLTDKDAVDLNDVYDQPSAMNSKQTLEIFEGTGQGQAKNIPALCHFGQPLDQTCYNPAATSTPGIRFPVAFGIPPGKFGKQKFEVDMLADVTIMCFVRGTGSGGPQNKATCNSGTSNSTFNDVSSYSRGTIVGVIEANLSFKAGKVKYSNTPSISQQLILVK
jgi:Flp pilus assembly protein TadG